MIEAGPLAQRLSGLSKRLHRRFDGRPELDRIDGWVRQITETLDSLHGVPARAVWAHPKTPKEHDPRPEVPSLDDPSPQVPPDPPAPTPEEEPAVGLGSLDAELQALGEEPLLPPPGEATQDLRPPRPKVPLADMPFDELKELAKAHGIQTYRTKRANIEKPLIRAGITEG